MLVTRSMASSSMGEVRRRLLIALICATAVVLTQAELNEEKQGQSRHDASSEAPFRRLQRIIDGQFPLETADALYVSETRNTAVPGLCLPPACSGMTLYAGQNYAEVELVLMNGAQESWAAPNARLKVVTSLLQQDVLTDQCQTAAADVTSTNVTVEWWQSGVGVATTSVSNKLEADYALRFKMAGLYKMCYSYAGTFADQDAQLVSNGIYSIEVHGVYDYNCPREHPTCLSERRYECYLRRLNFNTPQISNPSDDEYGYSKYGLVTSCVVNFAKFQNGYLGPTGKGSWGAEWVMPTGYDPHTGKAHDQYLEKTSCGTTPAAFICRDGGACDSGDAIIDIVASVTSNGEQGGQLNIPATSQHLEGDIGNSVYKPRSVFACYCANKNGCANAVDFIQEIGVLHFYATKVCHADDATCQYDYSGMVAQYRFRIRVECPTTACEATNLNRIKLVQQAIDGSGLPSNDLPSWDSNSGCGSARHGELLTGNADNKRFVLPTFEITPIDGRLTGTVNAPNCEDPTTCVLSGGTRQDYKEFPNSQSAGGPDYGFQWLLGTTNHEKRTFDGTRFVDICYCNSNCGTALNWFKVGSLRLTPTRLVSAATSRSNLPEQWSLEFMNQQGIIGLQRLYADEFTLGLQEDSLLKLVQDDAREISEFGSRNCGDEGYNSQYTEGLSNPVQASLNYLGKRQMQDPPDLQKIVFNSDAFVNTIIVTQGGSLAVCYCAITQDTTCTSRSNWKLVTHVTIKGPQFNQRWQFSTNVVFRFHYTGYGLSDGDTLRIISADGQCSDNNYNPNTAAYAYTGLKVNCPVPCQEVETVSDTITGDLSTKVLSQDAYGCNRRNTNCGTNDIIKVEVIDDSFTDLYFQLDPGLVAGEEITLGDNIECDPSDTVCTSEMLAALKGVFHYADKLENTAYAPNSYSLTHRVDSIRPTVAADCPQNPPGKSWPLCQKIRIPIGWPSSSRPLFRVVMAGANLQVENFGRGGQWTMHTRGSTKEEVMGLVERANLKVCWRFAGDAAVSKYVAEVGRMTIRNPAPMEGSTLSMTTTARGQLSPFILTFTTADGVTGLRYDEAVDSLRLKIVLTDIRLIDIYYSDLTGGDIPADVPSDDEMEEASQAICGKLFLEVWSDDMTNGFPLPKGCWYKTFLGSGTPGQPNYVASTRELYLIFEAKTGFKKATIYQLVMNMKVLEGPFNFGENPEVYSGGYYMTLYSLDDVTLRPYEAIESGSVRLTTEPQKPSEEQEDPRWRQPDGFKLVGGHEDLLELRSGDSIVAEIMGDKMIGGTSGAIKHSNIIRVFLWPLLQWQTTSSCTAACVFGAEKSFKCGTINVCQGLPTVPGMSLNILKIILPDANNWPDPGGLFGDTKIGIRIGGITPPTGGFFAERIPAQVSKADDTRPNYILSTGDYLWKEPNEGTTISKVVGTLGGGNTKPFKQETDNILYARMILSSTLKARTEFGTDAYFTVTLPTGYTCLDKNPEMTAGENAWAVPVDLAAFGTKVPQGRGMPDAGGTGHGWSVSGNTCTFTPKHPYGIVFAGSSIMFRIYTNNPSTALMRTADSNYWTLVMANRGEHPTDLQITPEYPFLHTGDPNYQANYAVLGTVTETSCQPTTFEPSTNRIEPQELRFFFRTEQQVSGGGYIRLSAPTGFSFNYPDVLLPVCNATDLDASYYVVPADPLDATLRLPGILSCTTQSAGTQAVIAVQDIIDGGRMFGVKIWVVNPTGWSSAHGAGWEVYTMDSSQNLVDGTMETVPFQENSQNS